MTGVWAAGILTMRGVSKKVTLDAVFGGTTTDPWGNTRMGFTVNGKINRKDFGVSFSMVSETGGLLLGEEIKINASAQFVKEAIKQGKAARDFILAAMNKVLPASGQLSQYAPKIEMTKIQPDQIQSFATDVELSSARKSIVHCCGIHSENG